MRSCRRFPAPWTSWGLADPVNAGLIRALLNQHGEADSVIKSPVRTSLDREKSPNLFESYALYYGVMFDADGLHGQIANDIEERFGLD